jgi:serine/threonine-protein kinase RsbW
MAAYEQLAMLRALTETVLLTTELTSDDVIDIQVAIDEVATELIDSAVRGSMIECDLIPGDDRVTVGINALTTTRDAISDWGLCWQIVRTVTDSVNADTGPFDAVAGGYPVIVEFDRALQFSR